MNTSKKQPALHLNSPVRYLKGVGPERELLLNKLAIYTILDLLLHKPKRYEDRRNFCKVCDLNDGMQAAVIGRIVALGTRVYPKSQKVAFELMLQDSSGILLCRWWNMPFLERVFHNGQDLVVYGQCKRSGKYLLMEHPETETIDPDGTEPFIHIGRIVPIYPLTEGLTQRMLRSIIWTAIELTELPTEIYPFRPPHQTLELKVAFRALHFPQSEQEIELARERLAFDEILPLQYKLQQRRLLLCKKAISPICCGTNHLMKPFLQSLEFELTAGQIKVLKEIRHDMGSKTPMRRLLQGDVGSGKTVVAACAALIAIESGYQVLFMVPTEILALQHFERFKKWMEPLKVPVRLCISSTAPVSSSTEPTIWIGTHALLNRQFYRERIGLVIIDEQHKFGVTQQESLVRRGLYPHLLVMTATPIPRTLALTIYGDLDISVLDCIPEGRGILRTFIRQEKALPKIWEFVRQQLEKGRQAYVIYPRLQEQESELELKAATQEYQRLQTMFNPFKVALLHGNLSTAQKLSTLKQFQSNQIQLLVCTSVVEVGIDVPNATVMVINNAERFGLASLHQLRGRIGRGPYPAYCILVTSTTKPETWARLKALEKLQDGFKVAELDLQLRGPGELVGRLQSGFPDLKFFEFHRDLLIAEKAKEFAKLLLEKNYPLKTFFRKTRQPTQVLLSPVSTVSSNYEEDANDQGL